MGNQFHASVRIRNPEIYKQLLTGEMLKS